MRIVLEQSEEGVDGFGWIAIGFQLLFWPDLILRLASETFGRKLLVGGVLLWLSGVVWVWRLVRMPPGVARHRGAIDAELPETIDLIAVCLDAGFSLRQAVQRLADEGSQAGPLKQELARVVAEFEDPGEHRRWGRGIRLVVVGEEADLGVPAEGRRSGGLGA